MENIENDSIKIEISGTTYNVTGLGGNNLVKLLSTLSAFVGVPVGALVDIAFGTVSAPDGQELNVDMIKIARNLAYGIGDGERNLKLIKTILATTSIVGSKSAKCLNNDALFDTHFNRKLSVLATLIKEVLAYQFADFFEQGGLVSRCTERLVAFLSSPGNQENILSRMQTLLFRTGDGTSGDR